MPCYSYECEQCKTKVDRVKKVADYQEPELCTGCGKKMKKVFTSSHSFKFVGSGFYQTDYKNKGK